MRDGKLCGGNSLQAENYATVPIRRFCTMFWKPPARPAEHNPPAWNLCAGSRPAPQGRGRMVGNMVARWHFRSFPVAGCEGDAAPGASDERAPAPSALPWDLRSCVRWATADDWCSFRGEPRDWQARLPGSSRRGRLVTDRAYVKGLNFGHGSSSSIYRRADESARKIRKLVSSL